MSVNDYDKAFNDAYDFVNDYNDDIKAAIVNNEVANDANKAVNDNNESEICVQSGSCQVE